MDDQYPDEEEGENKRGSAVNGRGGGVALVGGLGRFYGWPSSRIVRVSRASGGKDRHSKVLTSKGLRDRRMRLSVNTAIQFYDLQDRLGYDQPSKAVEWLLKAAAGSIAELPPMNNPFPDTPKQLCGEKRSTTAGSDQLRFGLTQVDMDDDGWDLDPSHTQVLPLAVKSSACSSNSETSKGSGHSFSRSASRMKARERAKERVAEKEKEKEIESSDLASLNPISHTTSFTELLSGGVHQNPSSRPANESNFLLKSPRQQWSSTPMDCFSTGLLGLPSSSGQMQPASPLDHHPELQHFSFVSDHLVHVVGGNGNSGDHNNNSNHSDYNLNFTISPSANSSSPVAGFNRGTLQSNSSSPSLLPHFQRFPDGSPGFFIGTTSPVENYHQFLAGYDARLQHCYGDAHQHSSQKGKAKS